MKEKRNVHLPWSNPRVATHVEKSKWNTPPAWSGRRTEAGMVSNTVGAPQQVNSKSKPAVKDLMAASEVFFAYLWPNVLLVACQ